jgi:K+-sensing histidine kinase KdpD
MINTRDRRIRMPSGVDSSAAERMGRDAPARAMPPEPNVAERIAELELSMRLRDEVLSMLAHDIRGPLFTVSLHTSLLDRLRPSAPECQTRLTQSLNEIQHAVSQVTVILSKLLEIDALGDGELWQEVVTQNTADMIEVAARVVEPLSRARGIHVVTRVRDGAGRLQCDRVQMVHVLVAMLAHAVRRAPLGGQAQLNATHTGMNVHVTAHDGGAPLTDVEAAQLFSPVADDDRAALPRRLLRARRVVETLGGSLDVRPDVVGGTILDVTLPAGKPRG